MKKLFCIFLLFAFTAGRKSSAQVFQFTVNVNYDQLVAQQKTDPQSMNKLQAYISDFLNSYKFSDDVFGRDEKIKCKLNLNLVSSPSQGVFEGNAQLIVTRPVYNSDYETVVLTYVDKSAKFTYLPTTQLYFNENSYTEELPYLLAFYGYIALAFDYDSFSKLGGTSYVEKAYNIVNLARNSSPFKKGWDQSGDTKNRYAFIENLRSQQFTPFRESMYNYYRLGLDIATENPAETRIKVLETLNTLKEVSLQRPASVLINTFFDAKSSELFNILIEGTTEQKAKAYAILTNLDPGKTQLYQPLSL